MASKNDKNKDDKDSIDQGMYQYNDVMKDFYSYKPTADDKEGNAIKRNFQANMVQSGFDASLAKDMAYSQAEIAQGNMTIAADLEQRNTAANMGQEFDYGMQSMEAQFKAQDKFADNQNERDLGMLNAQGEQARAQSETQGSQDRLTAAVQGGQDRSLAKVQGEYNVMDSKITADASKYGAKQTADASKYGAKQTADASKYQSDASVTNTKTQARSTDLATAASIVNTNTQADADKYGAKQAANASKYGADKTLAATKDTNKTSTKNIKVTGNQTRKTMGYQDQLDAGKENRQAARSRTMARSF